MIYATKRISRVNTAVLCFSTKEELKGYQRIYTNTKEITTLQMKNLDVSEDMMQTVNHKQLNFKYKIVLIG